MSPSELDPTGAMRLSPALSRGLATRGLLLVAFVAAYAIAWLLLLSAVRGILVRGTGSGDGGDLRQLTFIPRLIWFLLWLASTLAAVAIGGRWLVMRT